MISTTKRGRIGLIVGVLIAGLGIAGTLVLHNSSSSSNGNSTTGIKVVTAGRDIPAGTQITADMLTQETFPAPIPAGALTDPGGAVGKYAISTIVAHQVILPNTITDIGGTVTAPDPGTTTGTGTTPTAQSFALKSGDVAIAMPIDPQSAVGYYIQPGDRVDFLVSIGGGGAGGGIKYGFQDVLVLRVGGSLAAGGGGGAGGGAASRQDGLVIVELPRRQAEELAAILGGSTNIHIDRLVLRSKDQYGKGYLDSGGDNPYTTLPQDSLVNAASLSTVFH